MFVFALTNRLAIFPLINNPYSTSYVHLAGEHHFIYFYIAIVFFRIIEGLLLFFPTAFETMNFKKSLKAIAPDILIVGNSKPTKRKVDNAKNLISQKHVDVIFGSEKYICEKFKYSNNIN